MKLIVNKSLLNGKIAIPGSKSHTIRAITIAALAKGQSTIHNPLDSSDTISAVNCYKALGAKIDTTNPDKWVIIGNNAKIAPPAQIIDIGNSGTTLRIAMASAALADKNDIITLTGDHQIQSRPVGPLINSLNDLGANASSIKGNDKAPVAISGTLTGGHTTLKCITSQYLSSLLLAAPLAKNDTTIDVTLLNEPDYVQITLDWLDKQNIKYTNNQFQQFKIPGQQQYNAFDLPIPADFSSATFFLCAGAILDAQIELTGLDFADSQPDKAVADYLIQMGADLKITDNSVIIRNSPLKGTTIDMNRTPDALPAMAVTATFAEGETRLVNVPQARNKETDRITCMAEELKKMGANIEELPDGLIINKSNLHAAELDGRSDHRIVMALSLAAMAIDSQTTIDTAEAMNITFPTYTQLMKELGANMEITD